jgi:hypothetical protein
MCRFMMCVRDRLFYFYLEEANVSFYDVLK